MWLVGLNNSMGCQGKKTYRYKQELYMAVLIRRVVDQGTFSVGVEGKGNCGSVIEDLPVLLYIKAALDIELHCWALTTCYGMCR